MNLETAILEIKKFWNNDDDFPFGESQNKSHIHRLENEFKITLPHNLKDYISNFAPLKDFYFSTVGNPMCIYGVENLKYKQDGYNYNSIKNTEIGDWNKNFFIFADEGADPVIVDFEDLENGIQKLMHGAGNWETGTTAADTLGQFLLCSAALHHALSNFEDESIIDDENGFNLADNAAKWYFKNMRNWAGKYYDEWCSVFDNH
ncbi:SMI1/KNR4 family protein [Flavobacterium sp. SORGH_AS_0622]|uniref:SMI1/KNR4 family protein n=1 Tax=Flavobacterium sp. SORGH_AS_0622 TaxID=3041772 RepID=UPI002786FB8D|nr:SMI1/KNR4 family protein [Flavobacterium sp. SORGH_AS_0622]MDQ1163919.1 hypothetical protein [Flavobacterium sp. SORGH_AS_0622]